ncbi:MAG: S8 family serine peptidase [candidate division WOR-3 bacterium]|nr:MAG: S8 family serine peptidase [candidate division WOR-3 bacterium]
MVRSVIPILFAVLLGTAVGQARAAVSGPKVSLVQGYSFDPVAEHPELPVSLTVSGYDGDYGYYLIQFNGPIRDEWKKAVERAGAELLWYLPQYTFISRVPEDQVDDVSAIPEVRWLGLYQPAYKVFPGLENWGGPQTLIVVFFRGENEYGLLDRLQALGATGIVAEFNAWNKSVKLDIDAAQIPEVAGLPGVFWIEPYSEITPDNMDLQWVDQHGYTVSDTTRTVWAKGVVGSSITCGLTDMQLWMSHDAFRDTVNNTPGPTHRKVIHYFGTQGSSSHGTHTGGTVCGNDDEVGGSSWNDGLAKEAKLYFQYYSSFPTGWDMNVWFAGPESGVGGMRALNHSMSLSRKDTFNTYVFSDMTADQFIWNHPQFMHCNSMGNYSTNRMGHPVIAKNIIATGATQNGTDANQIATFTSRGPTADGRQKPQLVSPGEDVMSASNTNASGYRLMSGTSMSTPNMTAATALIRDYFRKGFYPTGDTNTGTPTEISAALNKAVAIVGADNDISGYTVPDNNIGWGRVDLDSSLYFAGDQSKLWVTDDTSGLTTGDSAVYTIEVTDSVRPFRVSLCWSDYPGTMQAALILVNNLDLTVVSPTGVEYKGNVYSGGESQTGGIYDTLNVEECFRLNSPETGSWTVKVSAPNVPQGPQPYALAAIGIFGAGPGHDVGVVRILAPIATIDSGTVVTPMALVGNFGSNPETFDAVFSIGQIYADTQSVSLVAGETDTVAFIDWIADTVGVFEARCSTMLSGDESVNNNARQDTFEVIAGSTAVFEDPNVPRVFFVDAGRPNPFDARTSVHYGLPVASQVELAVYSVGGQRIKTLVATERQAGYHKAVWSGVDEAGRSVSRGIYYLRMKTDSFLGVRKVVKLD